MEQLLQRLACSRRHLPRGLADSGGVFAAGQITRTSSRVDAQIKKIVP